MRGGGKGGWKKDWKRTQGKQNERSEGKKSDTVRKSERCEEQEVYQGLPSIGPPTVGNPKTHETNKL